MIDFSLDLNAETTLFYLTICFAIYSIACFSNINDAIGKNDLFYENGQIISKYKFFFLLCFVLIIAPINRGDFFHYCDNVQNYVKGTNYYMEDFYIWLIETVNCNYLLFRLVVWGGSFTLFLLTLSRFRINAHLGLFVLFALYVNIFDYARATLGMAFYFFGLSYIVVPGNKRITKMILGVALILCSVYFHKSIMFLVAMTPVIFLPFNKYTVLALIITFPIAAHYINDIFSGVMSIDMLAEDEYLSGKTTEYAGRTSGVANMVGMIRTTWHYLIFYVPCIVSTYHIYYKNKKENCPEQLVKLSKVVVCSLFFSTCFLFLDVDNSIMYYRTLNMSHIGLAIMLSGLYQYDVISNVIFKKVLYFCMADIICFEFLYGYYDKLF